MGEDLIGFASGDFNIYRYVSNSPINFADPSGLSKESGVGGCDGKGTKNPYKHCKEVPGNPNMIECKDKKTGKKKRKPKPADWDKYKKIEPTLKPWLPEITLPNIDWDKVKDTSKQIVIIGGVVFISIAGVLFAI